MFLSSWLESFKETVRLAPRLSGSRLRRHRRAPTPQPSETLEERALLVSSFQFPFPPGIAIQPVQISHASSVTGEPNKSFLPLDAPRVLDPTQVRLALGGLAGPFLSTELTAFTNDVNIVQSLDTLNSPGLDVFLEDLAPNAYIRFAAGPAKFGATTITVNAPSLGFGTPTTLDIPVWLNDVPSVNPIDNISVPEDTSLVTIPLSGITAGGGADDPFNGGQQRVIYASTSLPFLTGIPLIQYNADPMDQIGSLLIRPVKGAPVSITTLGDNEATITVTIEDGGVDNIVGKSYDPTTGDVNITNFDATLDNIRRSREFRFTIIPVNDLPTIDDVQTAITNLGAVVQTPDLTITVVDPTQFPPTASPNFVIQVDDERMRVTNVSGNVFSVTRGIDGTLIASHLFGARVTLIDDVVRLEDTLPGPPVLDVDLFTILDDQGRTVVNLSGITPGGGSSPIGNEQQQIRISSLAVPAQTVTDGFFTLTFDNGTQSFTTDLIPYDAPATDNRNETLTMTTSGTGGSFTLTLADNIGEETSLDDAISTALPGATSVFSVDDLNNFRSNSASIINSGGFVIAIDGEEMLVTDVASTPVTGNPNHKTLTVTRGYHGTTPAAHASSASVIEQRVTQLDEPLAGLGATAETRLTADVSDGSDTLVDTIDVQNASVFPLIFADSLVSDVAVADTVISLNDVTLFETLPRPFKIQIGTEVMVVTNVDATNNQFTVVRGQDLTIATVHAATDVVVNPFTIRINQEQMRVTSVTGNTLTVTRGEFLSGTKILGTPVNGTTPTAHGDGLSVGIFPKVTLIDGLLNVVDSAIFPALSTTAPFYDIRIGNEDLRVTFVSGNQLLVLRGIHATTIASHADRDQISRIHTTAPIANNATASEIQNALTGLSFIGQGNVEVLGGPISGTVPVTIRFINVRGALNLDNLTADISGVTANESQTITMSGLNFTGAGQFQLQFNSAGPFTAGIDLGSTADEIRLALEALPAINPGDVKVTGGPLPGTPIVIEFTGQYANTNLNNLGTSSVPSVVAPVSTGLQNNERQLITLTGNPLSGSFRLDHLRFGSFIVDTTGSIVYDPNDPTGINTGNNIEGQLEALFGILDVMVTPVSQTSWIVEFVNVGDRNEATLTLFSDTLTPATAGVAISTIENGNLGVQVLNASTSNGFRPVSSVVEQVSGALSVYQAMSDLQSMTLADLKTSGGQLPNQPVLVEFTGQYAGLELAMLTVNNSPLPIFGLSDAPAEARISDDFDVPPDGLPNRRFDGEDQHIMVQAISSNPDVIPNPTVVYTSAEQNAQLLIVNNTDEFGEADITITISDSGFDQDLNTLGDNGVITKTFHVRVRPTNDLPTIAPLPDLSRPKNSTPIPITLKGITTGGRENQDLRVTATATDLTGTPSSLLPNPSVVYSNGAATGTMTLEPIAGQVGTAIITVTVEDAGVDGVLNSTGDNGQRRVSFRFDVSELPTLGPTPATITILEDSTSVSSLQPLGLTGITAGAGEGTQPLQLTVSNLNTGLFTPANLNVVYVSPNTTGTLNYTPTAQLSGSDTFRLTLVDGGPDGQLGVAGALTADTTATSTLVSVNNAGSYPAIPTDKLTLPVSLTATTVTLSNVTTFPAFPTSPFRIQINGEVMTVTGVSGTTFTVIRAEDGTAAAAHAVNDRVVKPFKIQIGNELLRVTAITANNLNVVRGIDGTTATAHSSQDAIVHPFALDNLTITRDIAVQVNPVNDLPTLDAIKPDPINQPLGGSLTIPEGSGEQIISLSGITDGEGAGARQHLRIEAGSTNPALTGPITVVYTDGNPAGSIRFTPKANVFGSAGITVTVFDGGADNNLNTLEADFSDKTQRTLNVTVVPIGDAPTINTIANRTLNEDAPLQTVNLIGISDGDANTQDLRVAVSTTNTALISNLTLNYNPSNLQPTTGGTPPTTGTLSFVPGADRFGSASITATVTDGGADTRLGFDSLTNSLTALSSSNAVIISNPTRFPAAPGFNIVIGNEEMTVTGIAGNTFTVARAVNATPLEVHAIGSVVSAPNTVADNVSTSRTFNVTVNPINDAPAITTINGTSVVVVSSVTLPAISEDASPQTISLAGIGAGPNESQNVAVSVSSNNTGLIAPSVSYVNGNSTGTITFQPAANKFGTATLTVKITDAGPDGILATPSDNGVTTKTIVVNVNTVNDAPTLDAVPTVTVSEESGQKTVNLTGITAGGGEAQILKATPSLISSSIAGLITNLSLDYTSPSSTGVLKFTPGVGLFGTATIRVTVEDAGFDGVLATTALNGTFFRDIDVIVGNVVDPPTLAQPPAATINKNGYLSNSVTVTGISDGDLNTQTLTVTATSDNPGLVPNPTVTFIPSGTTPSTATQSATLVFDPEVNQLGTANITVTVSDGVGSSVSKTFVLTVVDANLPPTIDGIANINLTEPTFPANPVEQIVNLSGLTAGGNESQTLTVTATSSNTAAIPNPTVTYPSFDPTTGELRFTPTQNAAGTFTITVTVTDAGGNFTNTTFDVVIAQGDNDAPTIDTISNVVVAISGSPIAQTVDLSGIAAGPFETGPVGVSVMSNNTALIPTPTVNYTSPNTIGSLSFTPAAGMFGSSLITVTVSDGGADNNVATAGDNNTIGKTFTIYVVNPPTIDPITSPAAVNEDSGAQSVILANVTDGDSGSERGTVTVSSNNPSLFATLTVTPNDLSSSTPAVNYTFNPDANGTATVTVTVTDDGPDLAPSTGDEKSVSQSFTVVVNKVNDAPTVTVPATLTLTEDGPTGTINLTNIFAKLGALLDESGQPLRITASSADTNKVTISSVNYTSPQPTGSVIVAPVANASGGPVNVTITVEDGGTDNNLSTPIDNQSSSQVVAVSITAVNDQPTLNTIGDVTVNEDSGTGSVDLSGITAGPGESQGLMVTATSDNPFLIPDANLSVNYPSGSSIGTLQFTPLANMSGDAFITVTVTDDGSIDSIAKSFSKTFKVRVNAVNDKPVIVGLLATADSTVSLDGFTAFIDENLAVGTEIAEVDFADEGPLSALNVSIISGNTGNAFSITNDGTIQVANAAAINFEANPTFTITVKIVDNSPVAPTGQSAQRDFTIRLTDLSEILTIGSTNWPATGGLTLKRTGDGKVHVLNSSNLDVVPEHDFANVSNVVVTGRSGTADILTLDYFGGDPVPTGAFDGLTFNGGAGAGDTIKFTNASFDQLETTFGSSTSASIVDAAAVPTLGSIGVLGVEAITFNATVSANNLSFIYGSGNDVVTFTDDGNSDVSTFSANSSPLITFPASAGVTVDVGGGNNSVTFNSIENAGGPQVTVLAGDGIDVLRASAVGRAVSLSGGGGNDSLVGGSGDDILDGGDDDDTISGGFGSDQILGGSGTNALYESADASFSVGDGTTSGDLGSDAFSDIAFAILIGGASGNTISAAGFTGQATINGGGGNDSLTGSSQEDVITGGLGDDVIDGNGGDDTLIESGNVNFVLGDSTMTGLGTDTLSSIAFAVLTGGSGNNTLDASGFGGTVTLFGGAGNDILKGGNGDDSLSGDAGIDTLSGNGGTNTLNGGTEIDQVLESGDLDFELLASQLISSLGTDDLISIETAKLVGGDSDNTLNASAFAGKTTLQGGDGADTLIGGSNVDSLEGGNGDDVLTGGLGNDKLVGGANYDTIVADDLTVLTMTTTSMTATSAAGSSTDALSGMEAGRFTGTAAGNTLSGGTFAGALTIDGLEGNDTLTGGAGSDFIYGRAGKDRLTGGAGNDQIDGGSENDTISGLAGNDTILGGDGNDSLSGGENEDAIDGQAGNDKIFGDNGHDTLIGGTGLDSIGGGNGNDRLWSGDYASNTVDVSDGDKDTLISGAGTDTVTGDSGGDLDVMTDASNTAAEKAAAFVIDYESIFGALLGL